MRTDMAMLAVGPNQARTGQGVDSATEASIIEKRLQIQEGDWMGIVIDSTKNIARKLDKEELFYLLTEDEQTLKDHRN